MEVLMNKKRVSFTDKVNGKNRKVIVNSVEAEELYDILYRYITVKSYEELYKYVKEYVNRKLCKVERRTPQYYYIIAN